MNKIYSFVAFAVMSLVSLTASAWSYDMSDENAVLESEAYNYRPYKVYNFFAGLYNGEPMTTEAGDVVSGDGCLTVSGDKASFKLNGFDAFQVIAPVQMKNFFLQIGTGAINLRAGVNKDGLHNYGSGSRFFAISDVKAGQIIVCQWGVTSSRESVVQPADKISGATSCEFEDITEAVHAAQDALAGDVEEGDETPTHDSFSYWRATTDGFFVIELQRDCCMQGLQIWIDASAAEAVSSPSLKIAGVNGDSRLLEFKAGESTFGNEVSTYYSLDGEDPIFLKDSEEIDHYDYVYGEDEEGNRVVVDSVAVYKRVLDTDMVAEVGTYGDYLYNPEDGYISVYADADEDGDGIVVVKAASVSETGMVSDIVTINVSIGEIVLNAPTLTLQGLSGLQREYSIGWDNNTLCGEEFTITYEGDTDLYGEAQIGDIISIKENVKVTVHVEGYSDGVLEKEADVAGVDIRRKAAVVEDGDGNPVHDWDFVHLSDAQKNIIQGKVIESCYIITEEGDSLVYSAEEFENSQAADGTDLSGATANYAPSCWSWDGGRGRATLNVASDTIVDPATLHDRNANGYGYVEDFANVFPGMNINCPPNANNASCLFIYINGDLGAYFMARPTFTFSRESVAAGEYLMIYQGVGGSNYTNSRWPSIYEVPVGELLSVTLASGGVHVFYMDVYTYDNLPADELEDATKAYEEVVAVKDVKSFTMPIAGYYTFDGVKLSAPQKGINIVKYADGTTMKVLVK